MTDQGWPTLADVHAAVLRVDGRLETLTERQDAQGRELERHRVDDRRELDALTTRTEQLSTRLWRIAIVTGVIAAGGGTVAASAIRMIGG